MSKVKTNKPTYNKNSGFTLMFVPSSSGKTVSININRVHLYIIFSVISMIFFLFFIYSLNIHDVKNILNNAKIELNDAIKNNEILLHEKQDYESTIESQKESFKVKEHQHQNQINKFNEIIKYYEKKSEELQNKINNLHEVKQEIYNLISKNSIVDVADIDLSNILNTSNKSNITMLSFTNNNSDDLLTKFEDLENTLHIHENDLNLLKNEAIKINDVLRNIPKIWPAKGKITSFHGFRKNPFTNHKLEFHSGVDIKLPTGTPILAPADGIVSFSGWQNGYGYLVIIKHKNNIETYYAHNSKLLVKQNEKIEKNQTIAYSGSTGRSTGPHLHYEIRVNGNSRNPLEYIKYDE